MPRYIVQYIIGNRGETIKQLRYQTSSFVSATDLYFQYEQVKSFGQTGEIELVSNIWFSRFKSKEYYNYQNEAIYASGYIKHNIWHLHSLSTNKVNSSVRKMYILRPNRDQLRKMQLQGLRLGIEPLTRFGLKMYIFLTLEFTLFKKTSIR